MILLQKLNLGASVYSFAKWRQQHLVQRKVIICAKGLTHTHTHTSDSLDYWDDTNLGYHLVSGTTMWTHSIQMNNFKGNMMLTLQRAQRSPRGTEHTLWAGNQVSRELLISCHLAPCSSVILLLYEMPVLCTVTTVCTWSLPPGTAWKLSPLLTSRTDTITSNGYLHGDVPPLAS